MFEYFTIVYCLIFGACSQPPCFKEMVANNHYTVCRIDLEKSQLGLFLNDDHGKPYGSLRNLKNSVVNKGKSLRFAMNGGMYHRDYSPVGLYVENGIQQKSISTKGGYGNFHLLPNGVFFIDEHGAGVLETKQYIAGGKRPIFATQSGPMLAIDGKLHPRFLQYSDSLKIRNGVGVGEGGKIVYFAISRNPVRFWDFGELFRTHLKAPNALFLDGSISSLFTREQEQSSYMPAGPIIGVVE
jgi:uncharacterized protein YigE (DUF2233 family)